MNHAPSPAKAGGDDILGRFREIVSDPNNQRIHRVPRAGVLGKDPRFTDPFVVMHNGLRVLMGSYYGSFSQILVINRGVHKPRRSSPSRACSNGSRLARP